MAEVEFCEAIKMRGETMRIFESTFLRILVLFFALSNQTWAQTISSFEIPLKSGTILLEKGKIDTADSRYVIVQFEKTLKRNEIEELRDIGINLLSFLYKKAWFGQDYIKQVTISQVTGGISS